MRATTELKRSGLLRLLEQNSQPLVVMAAPNGYGKTVLCRQYIADKTALFVSCQLKHLNSSVFLKDLFAQLKLVCSIEIREDEQSTQSFLENLPEGVLVVFDGVQELSDASLRIMREIAYGLLATNQVIITTHMIKPLRWGALLAQTLLLGNQELKFSVAEIQSLGTSFGVKVRHAQINQLDGWPLLCVLALSGGQFSSDPGELIEDFLYQLPPELLELLLPLSYMNTWTETLPQQFGFSNTLADDGKIGASYLDLCYKYRLPLFEVTRGEYKPHSLLLEALRKEYLARGVVAEHERVAIELYVQDKNALEAVPLMLNAGQLSEALVFSLNFVSQLDYQGNVDGIVRFVRSLGLPTLLAAKLYSGEDKLNLERVHFQLQAHLVHAILYSVNPTSASVELEYLKTLPVPDDKLSQVFSRVLPLKLVQQLPTTRAEKELALDLFLDEWSEFHQASFQCALVRAELGMLVLHPKMRQFYDEWRSKDGVYTDDTPSRGIRLLMAEGKLDLALTESELLVSHYKNLIDLEPESESHYGECLAYVLEDKSFVLALLNRPEESLRTVTESISFALGCTSTTVISVKTSFIEVCIFHHRFEEAWEAFEVLESYASSMGILADVGRIFALKAFVQYRLNKINADQALFELRAISTNTPWDKLLTHYFMGVIYFDIGNLDAASEWLIYPSEFYAPMYRIPALLILDVCHNSTALNPIVALFPQTLQNIAFYSNNPLTVPEPLSHEIFVSIAGGKKEWFAKVDGLNLDLHLGIPFWVLSYLSLYPQASAMDLWSLIFGEIEDPKTISRKFDVTISQICKTIDKLISKKLCIFRDGDYYHSRYAIDSVYNNLDDMTIQELVKIEPAFGGTPLDTDGKRALSVKFNRMLFTAIQSRVHAGIDDIQVLTAAYDRLIQLQTSYGIDLEDDHTELIKKVIGVLCRAGRVAEAQKRVVIWTDAVEEFGLPELDFDFLDRFGLSA